MGWAFALMAALAGAVQAHEMGGTPMEHAMPPAPAAQRPVESHVLPPLPANLPGWLTNKKTNHIFYKRGPYNYDIYNLKTLAYDLNAVAVGHAMAYEDLVTGKAGTLETATFNRINRVLKNPPKFMPDEANISPTFGRKYGVLEQVFDWTHILHAQTVDVLASTKLTEAEKDKEIEALWDYYFTSVPYAITPLPMNMAWLDSQPYSGAFRTKYPKVNGLFWGYHWLQGAMYDGLWKQSPTGQQMGWEIMRERYHGVELYKTDREFMPMFAETSPRFAARFPKIANAFDNLHMLHDMVNDILASDWMTDKQQEEQVTRAIWLVSAQAHQHEKLGDGNEASNWHDHRHFEGMPGMGLMKGMKPDLMWMPGMGWMNMSECHHCSMGLVVDKASTVSAESWTMRVRCALCARDMSAETKGKAILRLATEDPERFITVVSDEEGNMKTDTPEAVFLEETASHARCNQWSLAFTSRQAFESWTKDNPKYADAKPLTFAQWSTKEAAGTPDTYVKPEGPSENPYESHSGGASP
jgi:hypothetical protein